MNFVASFRDLKGIITDFLCKEGVIIEPLRIFRFPSDLTIDILQTPLIFFLGNTFTITCCFVSFKELCIDSS